MTDQNATTTHDSGGPLKFPAPEFTRTRVAITQRLQGHTTSAGWIAPGLSPELDELRTEMLRLRGQAAAGIETLNKLAAKARAEDAAHANALRDAARDGFTTPPQDRRTSEEQRGAERAAVQERLWALVDVMAEVADKVVATIREQENQLLGDLRTRLTVTQEKRREAERLVAEVKAEEWMLHRRGQWVMTTSDDGPFGRQPAPVLEPPPAQFEPSLLRTSLERPWHRRPVSA